MIKYLISIGRVIVGFYLGIRLRISSKEVARKTSITKFFVVFFLVACEFILFDISSYFILLSGPVCYFLIREVATLVDVRLPRYVRRCCSYLGRVSYGIYVWHVPIGRLSPSDFFFDNLGWNMSGLVRTVFKVLCTFALIVLATEGSIRFVEVPIKKFVLSRLYARA